MRFPTVVLAIVSLISFLTVDSSNANLLIDFNSTSQDGGPHPEAGYQSYDAGHEVAEDFITRYFAVEFPVSGPATVSLTPSWPNTTDIRVQQMADRPGGNDAYWVGDRLDLLTDYLGIDSRTGSGGNGDWDGALYGTPTYMTLTLGALPAGTYNWTSCHHDTEYVWSDFQVEFSFDSGTYFGSPILMEMTNSTPGGNPSSYVTYNGEPPLSDPSDLPSTLTYSITADGVNDVVIRFAPYQDGVNPVAVHKQIFGINGFELTQQVILEPPVMQTPQIEPDGAALLRWNSSPGLVYNLYHSDYCNGDFILLQAGIEASPPLNEFYANIQGVDIKFWQVTAVQE